MKQLSKAVLLTVLGLGGMATTHAANYNNDLIIGFTSGSGTDTMYDLGAASSLIDGQTWDLSSLITGYDLSSVNWGIVGTVTTGHLSYVTSDPSFGIPPAVPSLSSWNQIKTGVTSLYQNFATAGAGQSATDLASDEVSWNSETITVPDPTSYANVNINPNVTGLTSADLYQQIDNGSTPTQIGTFALANNGVITFSLTPTPEPATYAMLAVGGIMLLCLRNQLRRQQS